MGYTHYWRQLRDVKGAEWAALVDGAKKVIEQSAKDGVPLYFEYDSDMKAIANGDEIRFNGRGDEGHETFLVTRKRRAFEDWERRFPRAPAGTPSFCKTARKPYDRAVVAILAYMSSVLPDAFTVSSDGDPEDWRAGVRLAREAWENDAIDAPRELTESA
jgi:hypothetical protein